MFCSCHIGARGGDREWPVLEQFEKSTTSILIGADQESMEKLKEKRGPKNNEFIFSYVMGDRDGDCQLYHTLSPYLTSALRPMKLVEDWNLFWLGTHYVLKEAVAVIKKESLKQRALDKLYLSDLRHVPRPDFLSIDTQGSELDIIKGSGKILDENIIGIMSEVEFHRLYEAQPLFGDICKYLQDKDFFFVGFNGMIQVAPYRYSLGLRGRGFDYTANALFLKRPDTTFSESYEKTLKLAFCASIYGVFEITWRCFDLLNSTSFFETFNPASIQEIFLLDLKNAYKNSPKILPPSIKEELEGESVEQKFEAIDLNKSEIFNVLQRYGLNEQANSLDENYKKALQYLKNSVQT